MAPYRESGHGQQAEQADHPILVARRPSRPRAEVSRHWNSRNLPSTVTPWRPWLTSRPGCRITKSATVRMPLGSRLSSRRSSSLPLMLWTLNPLLVRL